jgi:hypothetical protein
MNLKELYIDINKSKANEIVEKTDSIILKMLYSIWFTFLWIFNHYGTSMFLPLCWILGITIFFAGLYFFLSLVLILKSNDHRDRSIRFSLFKSPSSFVSHTGDYYNVTKWYMKLWYCFLVSLSIMLKMDFSNLYLNSKRYGFLKQILNIQWIISYFIIFSFIYSLKYNNSFVMAVFNKIY